MIPAVSAVSWACGEANDMIFAKDTPSMGVCNQYGETDSSPEERERRPCWYPYNSG